MIPMILPSSHYEQSSPESRIVAGSDSMHRSRTSRMLPALSLTWNHHVFVAGFGYPLGCDTPLFTLHHYLSWFAFLCEVLRSEYYALSLYALRRLRLNCSNRGYAVLGGLLLLVLAGSWVLHMTSVFLPQSTNGLWFVVSHGGKHERQQQDHRPLGFSICLVFPPDTHK